MTIIKISDGRLLAAVAPYQSNEGVLYYLEGVLITPAPQGGVFLVATDGHKMCVAHDASGETNGDHLIAIPTKLANAAKKTTHGWRRRVEINLADRRATVVSVNSHGDVETEHVEALQPDRCPIDGTFPDWRRIVPLPAQIGTGTVPALHAETTAALAQTAKMLNGIGWRRNAIAVHPTGEGTPALVRFGSADEPHPVFAVAVAGAVTSTVGPALPFSVGEAHAEAAE